MSTIHEIEVAEALGIRSQDVRILVSLHHLTPADDYNYTGQIEADSVMALKRRNARVAITYPSRLDDDLALTDIVDRMLHHTFDEHLFTTPTIWTTDDD